MKRKISQDWHTLNIVLIILVVIFIILGLSLKKLFGMSNKIQVLEKLNETDQRDIQFQRNLKENQFYDCFIRLQRNNIKFSNN